MTIKLYDYQTDAVNKLKNGNILVGGMGSGKSMTSLAYYIKVCGGSIDSDKIIKKSSMKTPKDLYIITTARKRDTMEWEQECIPFLLSTKKEFNKHNVKVTIDSWNNIPKYANVKDAFFIFDEQRVVGSGIWVKSFLKITKNNEWILLSATPGDTWMDYVPTFIANGFYKNRTEFIRRHVVYSRFSKFPKVDHYVEASRLARLRDSIIVNMHYNKPTISHDKNIMVEYDKELFNIVLSRRWNIYEDRPIKDVGELYYLMRHVVNEDQSRIEAIEELLSYHDKLIIFYNFNYEREMLLKFGKDIGIPIAQWNGHKHEKIPKTKKWLYIVQYTAGAEGWNCIETNAIVFYSQNYSYKITKQASGRIDRLNTPFSDLYYYYLRSNSPIDLAILKAFKNKKNFNEDRNI